MIPLLACTVFVGVACAVAGVVLWWSGRTLTTAEKRLGSLELVRGAARPRAQDSLGVLVRSVKNENPRLRRLEGAVGRWVDLRSLVTQAGIQVPPGIIVLLCAVGGVAGGLLGMALPMAWCLGPVLAAGGGFLPLAWVLLQRHRRLAAFERQFPEALELLSRSLRAGHSLADGIQMVAKEMANPISEEFGRCYEQQQLGLGFEDALQDLAAHIPLLDVRFFVTAIMLQRQTGGDAAEILDKIGRLIRERFQIRGQVKALTGEGRLSGVVLLALPVVLAIFMYFRNPTYLMTLFQDPLGQKMIAVAVISQLVGALVIKKIVDIRV